MMASRLILILLLLCTPALSAQLTPLHTTQAINLPPIIDNNSHTLVPIQNGLHLLQQHQSPHATSHFRYQQRINGLNVWGQHLLSHHRHRDHQHLLTGRLVTDHQHTMPLAKPSLSLATAQMLAKKYFQRQYTRSANWQLGDQHTELVYYFSDAHTPHLAYVITMMAHEHQQHLAAKPLIIMDAHSGKVLKSHNILTTDKMGTGPGGNHKPLVLGGMGKYEYGDSPAHDFLNVSINKKKCELNNRYVNTLDLQQQEQGGVAIRFECPRHLEPETNGGYSPENDAHAFANIVVEMFQDWYHMLPLPRKVIIKTHFSESYDNAFWDGHAIYLGDGNDFFYPLTSLQVIAHEIGHGVTDRFSRLNYFGQSGGINEAFSDMTGAAAEYYLRGTVQWDLDTEILKAHGKMTRSMRNPTADNNSFGRADVFINVEKKVEAGEIDEDNIDPHFGSGIFNKAFYLLSQRWDPKRAYDVMFYANQHYWHPSINFANAAWTVVKSAQELNYPIEDVIASFKYVGIDCVKTRCSIHSS